MVIARKEVEARDIEERMLGTALHECCHAIFYVHSGLQVTSVEIHPRRETRVVWPCQPKMLWNAYRQHPLRTLDQVRGIVGALLAPEVIREEKTVGDDLHYLQMWEFCWNFARVFSNPEGPTFAELCEQAKENVTAWYMRGRGGALARCMAHELLQRNIVSGKTLLELIDKYEHVTKPIHRRTRYVTR